MDASSRSMQRADPCGMAAGIRHSQNLPSFREGTM